MQLWQVLSVFLAYCISESQSKPRGGGPAKPDLGWSRAGMLDKRSLSLFGWNGVCVC